MCVHNRGKVISIDQYYRLLDVIGNTEMPSQLITDTIKNITGKCKIDKVKTTTPATLGNQSFPYQALPFSAFHLIFLLPSLNHFADIKIILFHKLY